MVRAHQFWVVSCVVAALRVVAREWLQRIWSKGFSLPVEQFDAINFAGIVLYKTGIIQFNLTPYIALRIAG